MSNLAQSFKEMSQPYMRKLLLLGSGCIVGASLIVGATRSDKGSVTRNLDIFNSLFKALQTTYVDTIDADKSVTTAIDAMLSQLDPYTEYIPESEQENFMTISTGEYGGIGSYIMTRDGNVYISDPQEDSPALKAGLRPGDLIIAVERRHRARPAQRQRVERQAQGTARHLGEGEGETPPT